MRTEFENTRLQHERRLAARSIVLPAQKAGIDYRRKEESDRIQSLCGSWRFLYVTDSTCAADEAWLREECSSWDEICVPSEWKSHIRSGSCENEVMRSLHPMGVYRRSFTVSAAAMGRDVILHFDGVCGTFCVYVNGEYVGFSRGGSMPVEFDVTEYARPGENDIAVALRPDGSAENCVLDSGIFRDVYLIYQNKLCLWDYEIKTTDTSVALVLYPNRENSELRAEVTLDRRTRRCELHTESSVRFDLPSPEAWNAENPYLYELVITVYQGQLPIEIHTKMVGLREAARTDGMLCVNGTPIVFCGVNLQEVYPGCGRAPSCAQIEADLKMLKAFGFNAVRCSSGPFHPAFYELCSALGFYVIDQADTCSCEALEAAARADACLACTERMYMRDKNETCVVAWSVGGNAGLSDAVRTCAQWLRARLNKKPLLLTQDDPLNPSLCDFRQWTDCDADMLRCIADTESDLPAIGVSYGSAARDGALGLSEIWDVLDENPQMQGAFVCALRTSDTADGFCFADGEPKPVLYEVKYLMSPLRIRDRDGALSVYCRNSFERIDNVTMIWNLCEDTRIVASGTRTGLGFGPGEVTEVPYPAAPPERMLPGARYYMNVMLFSGERDLGYAQVVFPGAAPTVPYVPEGEGTVCVSEDGPCVTAVLGDTRAVWRNGALHRLEYGGRVLLDAPMELFFDPAGVTWGGDDGTPTFHPEAHSVTEMAGGALVRFLGQITPFDSAAARKAEIVYGLYRDGTVCISVSCGGTADEWMRCGVRLALSKAFDHAVWHGRGWQENTPQRKSCTLIGRYEGKVCELPVLYERPTENGLRCDTRWLALADEAGAGVLFAGIPDFAFAVHPYSKDVLCRVVRGRDGEHDVLKNHVSLVFSNAASQEDAVRVSFVLAPWRGQEDAAAHIRAVYDL